MKTHNEIVIKSDKNDNQYASCIYMEHLYEERKYSDITLFNLLFEYILRSNLIVFVLSIPFL